MKEQYSSLLKKSLLSSLIILSLSASFSYAAGPRPKDFYLMMGGGVFSPDFILNKNAPVSNVDGPLAQSIIGASLPFLGLNQPLQIIGLSSSADWNPGRPENQTILSLGGGLGFKYNRHFGIEAHLDLGFPNILVKEINTNDAIDSDTDHLGRVHILAPDLLPIGASIIYTPIPDFIVSPYIGIGGLIALLDNRRAQSQPTDILVVDGGIEFGYMIHAGAHVDMGNEWFGFFDMKFASIDSPDFSTRRGLVAPVDRLDMRHIRVGAALRF